MTTLQDRLLSIHARVKSEIRTSGAEMVSNGDWTGNRFRIARADSYEDGENLTISCVVFPHLTNDGPIFGYHIEVEGGVIKKVFLDYSVGANCDHFMLKIFSKKVEDLRAVKTDDFVYSEKCVRFSDVKDSFDQMQLCHSVMGIFWYYIDNIHLYNGLSDEKIVGQLQNRYIEHRYGDYEHTTGLHPNFEYNETTISVG